LDTPFLPWVEDPNDPAIEQAYEMTRGYLINPESIVELEQWRTQNSFGAKGWTIFVVRKQFLTGLPMAFYFLLTV
jgi:hypothetical protein